MPGFGRITTKPIKSQATAGFESTPARRGVFYYIRGSWMFFKKMWPAVYDLTTTETYVNASAIAFNIMLSFFSFVVLIGSFLINIVHWQRGYETLYRLLRSIMPKESGMLFWSLDRVTQGPGGKATLVSFGLLILSSAGIFNPIEMALNRAWGFKERSVIMQYILYMLLVFVCGLVILCPVLLGSVYDLMLESILGDSPIRETLFNIIGPAISLPFIIALFFLIYYVVPHGKVQASQVFFTSVAMAVLWLIGTFAFRLALPLFDFEASYMQLASLMAIVTWLFITAFILILGANLSVHEVLPRSWTGRLPFSFRGNRP